jgi:hypothetical protein
MSNKKSFTAKAPPGYKPKAVENHHTKLIRAEGCLAASGRAE